MAASSNEDGPDVRVRHEGHVKNCDKIIGKQQQFPAADLFFFPFKIYVVVNFCFSFVFGIVC